LFEPSAFVVHRYLPFQNVHDPYTVDERYRDMYAAGTFTEDERTLFGYITCATTQIGPSF